MTLSVLLGGARSGKSTLALSRAARLGRPVVFVATAEARDDEMRDRIERHRAERPSAWSTCEEPLDLVAALSGAPAGVTVVVDCLSLWLSNVMERGDDAVTIDAAAEQAAAMAARRAGHVIAVSNEVGMGLVPMHPLGRAYRDRLGRVNATWTAHAETAQLVVAGRTLTLDPLEGPP